MSNFRGLVIAKNTSKCPICTGLYTLVEDSLDVCENHLEDETWLVVKCRVCSFTSFSKFPGICMNCKAKINPTVRSFYFEDFYFNKPIYDLSDLPL